MMIAASAPVATRPTHVRRWIVFLTLLMSLLLYLDRFCISFASPLIREDLGLTNAQMSWILGSFFLTYGLAQVPTGWFSDRFGPRAMLTIYILAWSLFTALTGLAGGFLLLLALRLGFGFAQAGAYPTAGSLLRSWVPFSERGKASGWVASGGRIGGAVAPMLTAYLVVMFVPLETSSQLRERDFLDFPHLCHQLHLPDANQKSSVTSGLLREKLTPKTLAVVDRRGAQYAAALAEQARDPQPLGPLLERFVQPPLIMEEKTRLIMDLNNRLVSPGLYVPEALPKVALPQEAKSLLSRTPGSLAQPELERLNRLVLEGVYPQDLKKIYVMGWRPVLVVYGLTGLLMAATFWFVFRNRPAQHPWCNPAEVELIAGGQPQTRPAQPVGGIPLGKLVRSTTMWMTSISQIGTNIGWVFLVTLLPRYLEEVHRMPIEIRSWMSAIPLWVGWLGMLCGGALTDRMVRTFGLRWGRALPMGLTRFLAMAAFLVCLLPLNDWVGPAATPWVLTAAFATVAFATDLGVPAVWAFCQDVGGRHVGSVLGWGNMWGNLGAAISPPLLNLLTEASAGGGPAQAATPNWNLAFAACAFSFLISGIAALGVDATKPIDVV